MLDDVECEVYVTYKLASGAKTMIRGFLPHLEYMLFYRGVFDDLCVPDLRESALADKPLFRLYGHERVKLRLVGYATKELKNIGKVLGFEMVDISPNPREL